MDEHEAVLENMNPDIASVFETVGVRHVPGRIETIDSAARKVAVVAADGRSEEMAYDRLVLAAGSQLFRPDIPGLADHGFETDQIDTAEALDAHLKALPHRSHSEARNTVVVAGGGLTGLETATEMPIRLRAALGADADFRVVIVDTAPQIGASLGAEALPHITEALAECGVESRAGVRVASVDADSVTLSSGERIATNTLVWTAGMRANAGEGKLDSEGKERTFTIRAVDPTDEKWSIQRTLWLDGAAPELDLSGQLAKATEQEGLEEKAQKLGDDELSLPTYELEIEAEDGTPSSPRSGVEEIQVFLDGGEKPVDTESFECTISGCPRVGTMTYTLKLPGLSMGQHSLRIVAVDQVGNETPDDRNILFEYIPATGMKDEYVMQHFRLPDGNDYSGKSEYHGPELAVNVINGNVVFHERDVDVSTERGELELERVYNSQQPTAEDTQWGRGWGIAEAPKLEPGSGGSALKAISSQGGATTSGVVIPDKDGEETVSPGLRARISKVDGGYEMVPFENSEAIIFSGSGRVEEVVLGSNTAAELEPEELELPSFEPPDFTSSYGSRGKGDGRFRQPVGAAVDTAGDLFVTDSGNDRVQKLDDEGKYLAQFGTSGTGNGQFDRPTDIAVDSGGNLWVADAGNDRIQKFSAAGAYLDQFGATPLPTSIPQDSQKSSKVEVIDHSH